MASQSSQSLATHSPEWPTQEMAADMLGTTVRTIQRMVSERELASRLQPVAGRKPVVLIDPADIDRVLSERRKTVVLPAVSNDADGKLQRMDAGLDPLAVIAEHLARIAAPVSTQAVVEKSWLTLDEAVGCGLSRRWLLAEAESEMSSIRIRDMGKRTRGGRWRFRRDDLGK